MTPNVSAADFPEWSHLAKPAPHRNLDGSTRPPIGTLADELRYAVDGFPEPMEDREQERVLAALATDTDFRRAFKLLLEQHKWD